MNFNDYAGLKATVESWLMRPDLVAEVPRFIELAEASINRKLRTRQMVKRVTLTADSRYVDLPEDWRKAWNVQRAGDDFPLAYLPPAEIDKLRFAQAKNAGHSQMPTATYYSLFGNSMELLPSPSAEDVVDIEILYYANVSPLTDASPTNWLLTEHPDLYLYGALVHTAPFLKEDERVPVWEKMFVEALAEANVEDADARRSGAPMSRPRLGF